MAAGGVRGSPGLCGQKYFRTTEQETSGFSAYAGCPRDVLLMTGIWRGGGCAPDLQRVRCPGEARGSLGLRFMAAGLAELCQARGRAK